MNRTLAAALGLALAGSLAAAVPSYADEPLPRPTITSPSSGEAVGDTLTITATAPGAPYVLFELRNNGDWRTVTNAPVLPGPDGAFSDTLPTKGLRSGFTATARSCRTSSASSCDYNEDLRDLTRMPLPAVTVGDGWREVIEPMAGSTQPVVIPDTTGLDVFLSTPKGRLAPGPAGPRSIDVSGLRDGRKAITIGQCSDLNPVVCTSRGVSFLVRSAPHAWTNGDHLLSQNRDGLWEAIRYRLVLDNVLPVRARWRILRGTTTVMGPVDYPESVISAARSGSGAYLSVDPRALLGHQLLAGSYRFEVEAIPDSVPGYTKRARVGFPLQVANASTDWRLRVDRSVIYPRDLTNAGPEVRLLHGLNADEVRHGEFGWRVVDIEGREVGDGWYSLGSVRDRITWNGQTRGGNPLPAGRYRFEVWATDHSAGTSRTSWSPYFTVSHRRRVYERVITDPARAARSLVRKTRLKYGRIVRGPRGSLDYFANAPGYRDPDLRTLHAVKLPANRVGPASIRFTGSWPHRSEHPWIFLIDRSGRRFQISSWDHIHRESMQFPVPKRFVRADSTVRFEVAVRRDGHTRVRAFRIAYSRYRWVS